MPSDNPTRSSNWIWVPVVNRANMCAALVKLVNATFAARDEMW